MRKMMKGGRKAKRLYLLTFILLLLSVAGSGVALVAYRTYNTAYHTDVSLAQEGVQHLRTAASLLETLPYHPAQIDLVRHAQREFGSARSTFSTLVTNLQALPGISTSIPVYGSRLQAALYLAAAATNISQAGSAGCALLETLLSSIHDPLRSAGHSLSTADITSMSQDFQQVKAALLQAIDEASQVQPDDLQQFAASSRGVMNSALIADFYKEMPVLRAWLGDVEKLFPVLPALLGIGTPANYLIEVLDSTELRPAGGFIGNYGIAAFAGGYLAGAQIRDVVLLDSPFENSGHHTPYPPNYTWFSNYLAPTSWGFRDSNLDADFPTAARYGELMYTREGGNVPVQGVIAITPALIQHVLEIVGPIDVPEYHETVTAQNLIPLIHFHQLGGAAAHQGSSLIPSSDGYSSTRKHFVALLAEQLFARVHNIPPSVLPKFLQLLINSLHTKDVQLYFNASSAENVLQSFHLDGAIQAPAGDSLFIVDANVSPNKANSFILTTVDDKVTLDGKGNATHSATFNYAWTIAGQDYGKPLYRDYVRIYVPPGSTLQSHNGWQAQGTGEAFGREMWSGFFTLTYGQTRTISLSWTVPHATIKEGNGWHYQYLIQRQAGIQRQLNLQVTLPPCAGVGNKRGSPTPGTGKVSSLTQTLNEDLNFGIDETCQ